MELRITDASWCSAKTVTRDFVRVRNPEPSPGWYWHIDYCAPDMPIVSVVIPTSDALRRGLCQRLLNQLTCQSMRQIEILIVKGDPRQGRAINIAASLARGKYLLTLDDDTSLHEPRTIERLVAAMESNPDIGIAGGNAIIPDDTSTFVKSAMRQIPRRSWVPVNQIIDSDLAQHPCFMLRTDDFKAIGGENELIPRGLDPYLRQEIRRIGKRVVLIPGVSYAHLVPDTLPVLLKQFYRNGRQAAFVNIHFPQWIIETPPTHGTFKAHVPFALRMIRFPARMIRSALFGGWIWVACQIWYAAGFIAEGISPRRT